jgi:hypothetical protein
MAELDSIRSIAYRVQIREEDIYFLLTLLFSVYLNAYISIRPGVMLAWSSAMPWPTSPRQHHRQHDSAETSHHVQVTLVASSFVWLSSDIAPWPTSPRQRHRQHSSTAPSPALTGGLAHVFPTSNPTQRFTTDQVQRLEEYHFVKLAKSYSQQYFLLS